MPAYTCVLWDVDSTIADASPGIMARLESVLVAHGRPRPSRADLMPWIGPPLFESFQRLGGFSPVEAETVLTEYRALAERDGYTASVQLYPGVAALIRALHRAGVPQSTASTKPEPQVRAILEHFELTPCFTAVSGARPGTVGRLDSKAFVVERALERLAAAGVDVSRPVLIGDRLHDVEGGAAHGIPVVFVDWGFGEPEEAATAIARVADADALRALLASGLAVDLG